MSEPIWPTLDAVIDIHAELLATFGGSGGIRAIGLHESALARPRNRFVRGEDDPALLAAAYAFGIARNHPFVDGNKRVAFAALIVFLGLNDVHFSVWQAEAAVAIDALAAGEIGEDVLARWIRDNWPMHPDVSS